jgi:hypothetical protein
MLRKRRRPPGASADFGAAADVKILFAAAASEVAVEPSRCRTATLDAEPPDAFLRCYAYATPAPPPVLPDAQSPRHDCQR